MYVNVPLSVGLFFYDKNRAALRQCAWGALHNCIRCEHNGALITKSRDAQERQPTETHLNVLQRILFLLLSKCYPDTQIPSL